VRGWACIMTDHELARAWEAEIKALDWYCFAPVPCIGKGSRVRLAGDGPSCWSVQLVVARRRQRGGAGSWKKGTKPGWYDHPKEKMPIVGGKPLSLMRAVVDDYTDPGDLVWDPCAGGGTTARACEDLGRRWVAGDIDEATARLALDRITGAGSRDADLPLLAAAIRAA
jgi:site-specific DNA-methyltransferase (adenine-specific)